MKKILIAGMTFAGAMGLFAQGALIWNNFEPGSIVFHVFSPNANTPPELVQGNNSVAYSATVRTGDYPTGTQTYTGVPIGGSAVGSGSAGWGNGNDYDAALYAAPGENYTGRLQLVAGTLTTFQTLNQTKAGWIIAPATDPIIPGTTYSGSGDTIDPTSTTVQVAAWYNDGGTINTLAQAELAGVPCGVSLEFNVDGLGGGTVPPPYLINASSFALVGDDVPELSPEPSTIAFGVMGGCSFLARRWMK